MIKQYLKLIFFQILNVEGKYVLDIIIWNIEVYIEQKGLRIA